MRNTMIVAEVAMLAGCLSLVWFGSQRLKVEKAPEASKILTEAVELTEVVEQAIKDADALRAAGDIELRSMHMFAPPVDCASPTKCRRGSAGRAIISGALRIMM